MAWRFLQVFSEYQMSTNSRTDCSSFLAISSATGARRIASSHPRDVTVTSNAYRFSNTFANHLNSA
jgi:hypothetical protein